MNYQEISDINIDKFAALNDRIVKAIGARTTQLGKRTRR